MKRSLMLSLFLIAALVLTLSAPVAGWADPVYQSTCNACGHVNTFTAEQVANEVLYCATCGALTMVSAEAPQQEEQGRWVFKGVDLQYDPHQWGEGGDPTGGAVSPSVEPQEGAVEITSTVVTAFSPFGSGDAITGRISWSPVPKRDLSPGETVNIDLRGDVLRSDNESFTKICFTTVAFLYQSGTYESKWYASSQGSVHVQGKENGSVAGATQDGSLPAQLTVYSKAPEEGQPGDRLTIQIQVHGTEYNYESVYCNYTYEWSGTGTAGAAPSGQDGVPVDRGPQIIDTDASKTPGDMSPNAMKTAIVVGAASAIAAAAAAAAAAGGGASSAQTAESVREAEKDALEKTGEYRMVVSKNFGATIEAGRPDQCVYARIEQVQPDGTWRHAPAMDAAVTILLSSSVTGLRLEPVPASGPYKGCGRRVILENEAPPAEAVISFKFQGPETYFQNNMTFRLGGKPAVEIAEHFCLLGTSQEVLEVPVVLKGFSKAPELELVYTSDLFGLKMAKDAKGQHILQAWAEEKASRMNFQRFVHRYSCEIVAKTDTTVVRTPFQVHLCYEGIGTAYEGVRNSELEEAMVLTCYGEAEKDKRLEDAYRLPLAVMRWNPSSRGLEADEDAASGLQLEFTANTSNKEIPAAEAVKAVEAAKIKVEPEQPPYPVKADLKLKPTVYRIHPEGDVKLSTAELGLVLTVTAPSGAFDALMLKGVLKPLTDFKAMIRWFLEYPKGTVADRYLKLGNCALYLKALDYIENRVYERDHVPLVDNTMVIHRADGSYYEHGKGDIMRKPYIAVVTMPKGVGDYEPVKTLYHELTHTLEDIELNERDGSAEDGAERRAWFLQFLADAAFSLADAERTGDLKRIGNAIEGMNSAFHHEFVIDRANIQSDAAAFGALCTFTSHELFAYYGTQYDGPNAEQVRREVLRLYFPGNTSRAESVDELMKNKPLMQSVFVEQEGLFQGGEWHFRWNGGMMSRIEFKHPAYEGQVENRAWNPEKGLFLSAEMLLKDLASKKTESVKVSLDAGWFSPQRITYPKVDEFQVTWRTENLSWEGLLYPALNGMAESRSVIRRKP